MNFASESSGFDEVNHFQTTKSPIIMFIPGQKVVCVNGQFASGLAQYFPSLPQEGSTYTIRDVVPGISPQCTEGEVAVYLCEIIGSVNKHGIERGFNAERFMPLDLDTEEQEHEEYAYA